MLLWCSDGATLWTPTGSINGASIKWFLRTSSQSHRSAMLPLVAPRASAPDRRVPVLRDLAVLDAEHVEPGGRVLLCSVLRIGVLAGEDQDHEVALRDDGHQRRLHARL